MASIKASAQTCAVASDAARASVDRFLLRAGDSAFRAIHNVTARSSSALEPLRDGPDGKLCARMNAVFYGGGPAAYFRYRDLIIGTDARDLMVNGQMQITERRHVLVFNSDGRFLYLPGQTPLRNPKATAKRGARTQKNEEARSSAELAVANCVRQNVAGPITFEPRIHLKGGWVVRQAPANSSATRARWERSWGC
jgi:hypothetical protein